MAAKTASELNKIHMAIKSIPYVTAEVVIKGLTPALVAMVNATITTEGAAPPAPPGPEASSSSTPAWNGSGGWNDWWQSDSNWCWDDRNRSRWWDEGGRNDSSQKWNNQQE